MAIIAAQRCRPCPGYSENGDAVIVREREQDTLLAMVDGVGHGTKAATASRAAVAFLESTEETDLVEIMRGCNRALTDTRGGAVAIVQCFHGVTTISHIAVGNVKCYLWSPGDVETLFNKNGIVGRLHSLPSPTTYETIDQQLLILHTDGISSRKVLAEMANWDGVLENQAERLMAHSEQRDDACLLLAQLQHGNGSSNS